MNQAEQCVERGEVFPPLPELDSGKVKYWIHFIQRFEEGHRGNEAKKLALEANVIAYEAQMGQILSHLHSNIAALYDNLGQSRRAEDVRRRAEAVRGESRVHTIQQPIA